MLQRHTFILDKKELCEVFGSLRGVERIKQRVFHLNKLGERFNNRLTFSSVDETLAIHCESHEGVKALIGRLIHAKGHIQRALGQLLERKFRQDIVGASPDFVGGFLENHAKAVMGTFSGSLSSLGLPPVEASWINPPFSVEKCADAVKEIPLPCPVTDLIHSCLSALPHGLILVLGKAGSGKSALLGQVFSEIIGKKSESNKPLVPVFAEAKNLFLETVSPSVFWGSLPAGHARFAEELESLWQKGNLAVFLDGLDENPKCLDFANPKVLEFWEMASQNFCVASVRQEFWKSRVKEAFFEKRYGSRIALKIHLMDWRAEQLKALFDRLAVWWHQMGKAEEMAFLEQLAPLVCGELETRLGFFSKTPLVALMCAAFLVSRKAGELPVKNDELIEHVFRGLLDWETSKPNVFFDSSAAHDLAMLIAKLARPKRGSSETARPLAVVDGQKAVEFSKVWQAVCRSHPFYKNKAGQFFDSVIRLPFLSYDGKNNRFLMDARLADFLTTPTPKRIPSKKTLRKS